ncbi:hypothetical protein BDEG_22387 [Batrachochytrium dendrobatidis JEL423]|uniref:Uncharacterized protein n=1 Tax=Batrachochytrium dendrobatidis (strain JEL423) TaxID=403673 RepID=A0A177WEK2_BATDL|nr:hypothetical protein BDEG_22387 [Batrachochytrium dendrobatidis JEL423]
MAGKQLMNKDGIKSKRSCRHFRLAGASARKTLARNKKIITQLRLGISIALSIHILVRIAWFWSSWTMWPAIGSILASSVASFLHMHMENMANTGTDLAQEGTMISYFYDSIYITWFVLAIVCVSDTSSSNTDGTSASLNNKASKKTAATRKS